MFISASSLGDSREQRYYKFSQFGDLGVQSTCYVCKESNSVDKKQPCFKNPATLIVGTIPERKCTTDKGCFIKRREETDEYGDVTK